MIAIVGHNGAGKSTLLKLLASWLAPDSGQVTVDGIELDQVTQRLEDEGVEKFNQPFDALMAALTASRKK